MVDRLRSLGRKRRGPQDDRFLAFCVHLVRGREVRLALEELQESEKLR